MTRTSLPANSCFPITKGKKSPMTAPRTNSKQLANELVSQRASQLGTVNRESLDSMICGVPLHERQTVAAFLTMKSWRWLDGKPTLCFCAISGVQKTGCGALFPRWMALTAKPVKPKLPIDKAKIRQSDPVFDEKKK